MKDLQIIGEHEGGQSGFYQEQEVGCTSADLHDPAVAVPGFISRLLFGESQEDGTGSRQSGSGGLRLRSILGIMNDQRLIGDRIMK